MEALPMVGGEVYFRRTIDAIPTELKDTLKEIEGNKPYKQPPLDYSLLDIRVGRVMRVTKNPYDVKSLKKSYMLKVEIGWERAPRIIVSELAEYYTREQLKLQKVIVLCNIQPEAAFGQRSWGWILAAETPDGDIELLQPPPESTEIDQVTVWGYPQARDIREHPDLQWRQVKKLFKDLRISPEGEAQYQGLPMCIEGGYNPVRAGRYARDTPIVNAVKNRSWKKYKPELTTTQRRNQLREFIP